MKRIFSKKFGILGGTALAALAAPVAALALGVGQPTLGDVEATFSVNLSAAPTINFCTSPSGNSFVERGFKWKGSMTDANPSGHIYALNGVLSITGTFTINGTTGEGVGNGFITLTTNTGSKIFQGSFELPTQVTSPQTGSAVARGLIDVPLYTNNATNGSRLLGNIEASLDGNTGALTGFMGKTLASPAVPDISMEFNEKTCA